MVGHLVVIAGPDLGRTFTLEEGKTLIIGRGQDSHTQLNDAKASRKHCLLQVDSGKFVIYDEGSTAGTFVNGQRATRCELKPGDKLLVGSTELRLLLDKPQLDDELTLASPEANRPKAIPKVAPLKELVGKSLAHFELTKVIATGDTGMVFLAKDTKDDRLAAVKVLWPEASQEEEEMQRFVRAMKTMMPIRHDNLVEIYAAG